ncbi:hypothetical protein PRUPE_6G215100 [Prunus persica]|uniref:F-box domain-containing protein n=1 Tax=Prunus persica TaxID=3760 RepID=M5WPT9_PRUPE|nr:hypothetical protein PRUPE_6G215100 [Prunus persica]
MPVKKFKQHIPEEMTLRILHRLPLKSLIRFSCFAKTHYNLAREQQTLSHRLLVSTQTSGLESIDLETRSFGDNSGVRRLSSPFNEPGHLRFLGSCNGLVFVLLEYSALDCDTCHNLTVVVSLFVICSYIEDFLM